MSKAKLTGRSKVKTIQPILLEDLEHNPGQGDQEITQPEEHTDTPDPQPANGSNSKELTFFGKFALMVENTNWVKRHLNEDKQSQHDNPTHGDPVS